MLLKVENLTIRFNDFIAVNNLNFELEKGDTLGIVGESGAGKTVTARAILKILDPNAKVEGKVLWKGVNLLKLDEKQMTKIRGSQIAMIFQNPQLALNPSFTIEEQMTSLLKLHKKLNHKEAIEQTKEFLKLAQADALIPRLKYYPNQISMGEAQRVMIAMAIACQPELLICDEPTSSLDVTLQAEIIQLLSELQEKLKFSMIFISHDLAVISKIASRLLVMFKGEIVEQGYTEEIFSNPKNEYTKKLLNSALFINSKIKIN
jgi:ABC-type glutathione transport system ATPase component